MPLIPESVPVGLVVEMDLPELGLTNLAWVTDLEDCPEIASGDGRVVTATFHHSSGDVIDLAVAGAESGRSASEPETIGTTSNHPFWSVDRQEYVQAGQLDVGERVVTFSGDTKRIVGKLPRPGPQPVYNLEVHAEHVYFVGQDGLLVHNAYNKGAKVRTSGNLRTETLPSGKTKFYIKQNGRWQGVRKGATPTRDPRHHLFPQEESLRIQFEARGIDIDAHTIELPLAVHQRVHRGAGGGEWNAEWHRFFSQNPNATDVDIFKHTGNMIHRFDIDGLPVIPYR